MIPEMQDEDIIPVIEELEHQFSREDQESIEQIERELSSDSQSKPSPFKFTMIGIVIGMVITGIGGSLLTPRSPKTAEKAPITTKKQAQSVTVSPVIPTRLKRTLTTTGAIFPYELIPVTTPATGLQIRQLLADEGNFVKRGQILARLDDSVLRAELSQAQAGVLQAEASLAEIQRGARVEEINRSKEQVKMAESAVKQARSNLELVSKRVERNRELQKEGAISVDRLDDFLTQQQIARENLQQSLAKLAESQQKLTELLRGSRIEDITQAQAQLASAKARVQTITAQLRHTVITAPVSGKIAQRNAKIGDLTSSSLDLFTIIENGRLELQIKVPETQLSQIEIGQEVELLSEQNKQFSLVGTIREIVPTIDEKSRQATLRIDLPPVENLRPGMFFKAKIIVSSSDGFSIPAEAILPQSDGRMLVYVLGENNQAKAKYITTGEVLSGGNIEVKEGLLPNDKIIVKGSAYLKNNDLVSIYSEKEK